MTIGSKKLSGIILLLTVLIALPASTAQMDTTVKPLQIVAGENFWGNLFQIGGSHVQVLSVVSDPNADPHEYESNTSNALAFANADY